MEQYPWVFEMNHCKVFDTFCCHAPLAIFALFMVLGAAMFAEDAASIVGRSTTMPRPDFSRTQITVRLTDKAGNVETKEVKGSKNRKIFMYYVLKDTASVRRFVSDMLKFEGEERGKPLLDKEYFMNSEILADALKILEGMQIYIQITKSTNDDGTTRSWQNLISWKRAAALDLPM